MISPDVIIATDASGNVVHWHAHSKKMLHSLTEKKNQIFALDLSNDGKLFATGGKDYNLRVYDDSRKECIVQMEKG